MRQADKSFFTWFALLVAIAIILFSVVCYSLFYSQDRLFKVQGNEFPVELKGRVIDIKVNNETHQYIQYRTSRFKHSFQLTHWEGCKYCQEKTVKKK